MTELTDSFETLTGWSDRDGFGASSYYQVDTPLNFTGVSGSPVDGSKVLATLDGQATQGFLYQAITGTQEFDVRFYFAGFWTSESTPEAEYVEIYLDDSDNLTAHGTPILKPATLAANLFGVSVQYYPQVGSVIYVKYRKASGTVTNLFNVNISASEMPANVDSWAMWGVRLIVSNSVCKLYTDLNNTGSWVLQKQQTLTTEIATNLTNIVVGLSVYDVTDAWADKAYLDYFRLGTGADIQDIDAVVAGIDLGGGVGGSTTAAGVSAIKAVQEGEEQGYATLLIEDIGLTNFATIMANLKQVITVRDTVYNNEIVRGEVNSIMKLGASNYQMKIQHNSRKTLRQPVDFNPIIHKGIAKYVSADTLYDKDASISDSGNGEAVVMVKENMRRQIMHPSSVTTVLPGVASGTDGSINNLYFDEGGDVVANRLLYSETFTDASSYFADFYFDVWKYQGTSFAFFKVKIVWQASNPSGHDTDPYVQVYNADTPAYETVESYPVADLIPAVPYTTEFTSDDLVGAVTDYFNDLATSNTSDYDKFQFRVGLNFGDNTVSNSTTTLKIFKVEIEIYYSGDQPTSLSQGSLASSPYAAAQTLDLDNVTPSWALTDFPLSEGFGYGDTYYVVRMLDTLMTAIFANLTGYAYTEDVTGIENETLFTKDLTNLYLNYPLNKINDTLNARWWLDPATGVITQMSIDRIIATRSTGITFTNDDVVGGLAGVQYTLDGSNLRDGLRIISKNQIDTVSISPDYTLQGGSEVEVYTDTNLTSGKAINAAITELVNRFSTAIKEISFMVNFSDPKQSYSALGLFKTATVSFHDETTAENTIISISNMIITRLELDVNQGVGFAQYATIRLEVLQQ